MACMLSLPNPKSKRPDSFYLGLTVAGYLTLSLAVYCFGQSFMGGWSCDVPQCWDPKYAHDPNAFLLLIPGLILGLLGLVQLRLDRRGSAAANHGILRRSFQCSVFAIIGFCIVVGLGGGESSFPYIDMIRLIIAIASLALFIAGVLLSLINITWNVVRASSLPKDRPS
jgi:hypothetical protein